MSRFKCYFVLSGLVKRKMTEYSCEDLSSKLKRERVEACLNCKSFVTCNEIGQYEVCDHFEEVEGEAWIVKKLG